MQTQENVPSALRPQAAAALNWVNENQGRNFELTGLVDYEQALQTTTNETHEFGLVLCDGEICTREQVRVEPANEGYCFSYVEAAPSDIPPLLDPPAGLRSSWLDDELKKHEFVLLLFYRGLW